MEGTGWKEKEKAKELEKNVKEKTWNIWKCKIKDRKTMENNNNTLAIEGLLIS